VLRELKERKAFKVVLALKGLQVYKDLLALKVHQG
jgi:hypothetical protein